MMLMSLMVMVGKVGGVVGLKVLFMMGTGESEGPVRAPFFREDQLI